VTIIIIKVAVFIARPQALRTTLSVKNNIKSTGF